MGQRSADAAGVDSTGFGKGGEGGFKGKCVFLQPRHQCRLSKDARVGILGCVYVSIYSMLTSCPFKLRDFFSVDEEEN